MSIDYYNQQNNINVYEKNPFLNNNNITNISPNDNSKTIENIDDIAEVPVKDPDIDYLQKFSLENGSNTFQIPAPRKYSLNIVRTPKHKNYFENNLNRPTSGKIPHPRKTHGIISFDRNRLGNNLNKRNSSGEKPPSKRVQSKYSSVSENKYQFIQRYEGAQNFGIPNFTENYNIKANYGPLDSTKGKRKRSSGMAINNMNVPGQKTYRSPNLNVINGFYLNQNTNQNLLYDGRKNRLNNKGISTYNNNTINVTKFKNNIQFNNKLVTNFDVINRNKSPQNYQNNQNINNYNKYTYNNQNVNFVNQRLTTGGYNTNANENINTFYERYTSPSQVNKNPINQNKIVETATVTKIFSSKDNLNTNNKKKVNHSNEGAVSEELDNLINQINRKSEEYLEKMEKLKNDNIPQDNQRQTISNNFNNNNILTQEEINQIFAKQSNPYSDNKNIAYINPTASNIIAPNSNLKLQTKYSTRTNQIITRNNFNSRNINELIGRNQNQNINIYNQPESTRLTITNEKTNNIISNPINVNKPIINNNNTNNNFELIYNDFDGSGLLKNYNGVSLPGKNYAGKTKTNQDAFICNTNINNIKDFNIFGVLDGHGPDGHFVSEFVSNFIPNQIINNPEIKNLSTPEEVYKKLKENNYKIINQSFVQSDKQLKTMQFDIRESGCTCCLVIHIGKHIICANTGDSRAIVAYDQVNDINSKNLDFLTVMPLSIDNKPELTEEISRILMAGGVVAKLKNDFGEEVGPYRVWVKGKDYPGLAMSRSIGDLFAKSVGVIPDPTILEYNINKSTKFIIACSDGVWEFLDNETVMNIGKKYYLKNDAVELSHELISRSFKEWTENDKIVDDITAVVAFF